MSIPYLQDYGFFGEGEKPRWLEDLIAWAADGPAPGLLSWGGRLAAPGVAGEPPRIVRDAADLRGTLVAEVRQALRRHGGLEQKEEQAAEAALATLMGLPDRLLGRLVARSEWRGVPAVERVARVPEVVKTDDGLTTTDGDPAFDRRSGTWFAVPESLWDHLYEVGLFDEDVTERDASAALDLLVGEEGLLGEFPFASQADRANALALLLLPFGRAVIDGPTPLHLVDAPKPRTGKSLLVEACLRVADPTLAPSLLPTAESAVDNLIRTRLRAGAPCVWLDNVHGLRGVVDSASLAGALTARRWGGRMLHTMDADDPPNQAVWALTANNARLSEELTARSLWIHLDRESPKPGTHPIKRQEPLLAWAEENRPALVAAALTLWQWWIQAGAPFRPEPKRCGGFEAWEGTMRGVLEACGVDGFFENAGKRDEEVDAETAERRELLRMVEDVVGVGSEFTAAGLSEVGAKWVGEVGTRSPMGLGKRLGRLLLDQPVDGLVLRRVKRPKESARWRLDRLGE
jgi:hypothetical protein